MQNTEITGEVRVSDRALHSIIRGATMSVVGIAPLSHDSPTIRVNSLEIGIAVELRIAVQYGAPIVVVAQQVSDQVRARLEYALGLPVTDIQVFVQGTRRA